MQANQVLVMSAREEFQDDNRRKGDAGEFILTSNITTTSKIPVDGLNPVDYEQLDEVTSGPTRIYIKKNSGKTGINHHWYAWYLVFSVNDDMGDW